MFVPLVLVQLEPKVGQVELVLVQLELVQLVVAVELALV